MRCFHFWHIPLCPPEATMCSEKPLSQKLRQGSGRNPLDTVPKEKGVGESCSASRFLSGQEKNSQLHFSVCILCFNIFNPLAGLYSVLVQAQSHLGVADIKIRTNDVPMSPIRSITWKRLDSVFLASADQNQWVSLVLLSFDERNISIHTYLFSAVGQNAHEVFRISEKKLQTLKGF